MKNFAFILLASLAMTQAEALSSPLYQGAIELKAILGDEQLGQKLGAGEVIAKIEKTDQGYEITTNKHTLPVYVDYEPAKMPGPAHYKIRFGETAPL